MRRICALLVMLVLPPAARGEGPPDPGPIASGGIVTTGAGVTASEVAAALKNAGYPADATTDNAGDPFIRSSTGKIVFIVHFFQCGPELRCGSVQFTAPFRHKFVTQATVGAWNREHRFGRAFQDSHGIAWLSMDVETGHGMTADALAANVARWISVLNNFEAFVAR